MGKLGRTARDVPYRPAMTYPRRCPLCAAQYGAYGSGGPAETQHVTLLARSGGTPSPWRPELPGRLLRLRCLLCGGTYGWDYFAGCPAALVQFADHRPEHQVQLPRAWGRG